MNIPDYTLLQSCGRGAYGQVWLAQSQTNKLVALKYVPYTLAGEREFEGLLNFSKLPEAPNLIRILHLGKLEDGFFYTMELADGLYSQGVYVPESLAERIKRQRRLSPAEVMDLAFAVLGALNSLHAAGLIHRDIKPENILYVNGVPKLSDMGLVRDAEGTISLCGTIGFIPPERLIPGQNCLCDKGDDLYALGKVLYCALTGNTVEKFPSFSGDMISNTVCSHLNRVILKACGNRTERFCCADDFISALKNGLEQKEQSRSFFADNFGKYIFRAVVGLMSLAVIAGIWFFAVKKSDADIRKAKDELEAVQKKLEEERKRMETENMIQAEFHRREEARREEDRKLREETRKKSEELLKQITETTRSR